MDNANGLNHLFDGSTHRRKRTHTQMREEDSRIDSYLANSSQHPAAASASLNRFFPPPPVRHYPGDGFDFRRPAMSTSTNEVVDLTGLDSSPPPDITASRPSQRTTRISPGPGQEVIILDDSDDEVEETGRNEFRDSRARRERIGAVGNIQETPDVEFIRTSTIQPPPPDPSMFGLAYHASRSRSSRDVPPPWVDQFNVGGVLAHLPRVLFGQLQAHGRPPTHLPTVGIAEAPRQNFRPPDPNMRYTDAAFALSRQPVPYQAPEPAREGFTRTPAKGDVLVCPNCDQELGLGESEIERQIWVIKSCGHVYCGKCATSRHKSKRARGSTTKAFTKCVVDECQNTSVVSAKAMFQVYI